LKHGYSLVSPSGLSAGFSPSGSLATLRVAFLTVVLGAAAPSFFGLASARGFAGGRLPAFGAGFLARFGSAGASAGAGAPAAPAAAPWASAFESTSPL